MTRPDLTLVRARLARIRADAPRPDDQPPPITDGCDPQPPDVRAARLAERAAARQARALAPRRHLRAVR